MLGHKIAIKQMMGCMSWMICQAGSTYKKSLFNIASFYTSTRLVCAKD
jgi:hypothetical protein